MGSFFYFFESYIFIFLPFFQNNQIYDVKNIYLCEII